MVHVVVDDATRDRPRARAWAAATATLLKKQNPIALAQREDGLPTTHACSSRAHP